MLDRMLDAAHRIPGGMVTITLDFREVDALVRGYHEGDSDALDRCADVVARLDSAMSEALFGPGEGSDAT